MAEKKVAKAKVQLPTQTEVLKVLKEGGFENATAFTSTGVREDVINVVVTVKKD